MAEMARFRMPTKKLFFSIRNQVQIPVPGGVKMYDILESDAYAAISYFHAQGRARLMHLYASGQHVTSIEEENGDSQVAIFDSLEVMYPDFLSLHCNEATESMETLEIPANLLVGLLSSLPASQAIGFLCSNANVSYNFAKDFVADAYHAIAQEHYYAFDKRRSGFSFIRFLKGTGRLWRIIPAADGKELRVKQISNGVYQQSVRKFLYAMMGGNVL